MTVYNCDLENSMVLDTYTPDAHDDPHAQDRDDCDELLTGTKGSGLAAGGVIAFDGVTKSEAEWATHLGLTPAAFAKRIQRHGAQRAIDMGHSDRLFMKHLSPAERSLARLTANASPSADGCLVFAGYVDKNGYGMLWDSRLKKNISAHRLAYELHSGLPIPVGMTVDHVCWKRACVNPEHLQLLSNRDNSLRQQRRTSPTCIHGHPLSGDNLYISPSGWRRCRACKSANRKRHSVKRAIAQKLRNGCPIPGEDVTTHRAAVAEPSDSLAAGPELEVRFTHAEALRVLDLCRLDVQTSIATRSADPATVSAMLKLCERVNARGAVNER